MRGIIASLIIVLIACSYTVEALGLPLAMGVGPVRTLALMGTSIWGAAEVFLLWRRTLESPASAGAQTDEIQGLRLSLAAQTDEIQGLRLSLAARTKEWEEAKATVSSQLADRGVSEVIQVLSLLQSKGRFIDFVMDDVSRYSDAQIGAAARIVHQGCAAVMREYFDVKAVAEAQEGANVTLDSHFDPEQYRLVGRVSGEAPYRGQLLHRGWLTRFVRLPERVDLGLGHEAGKEPTGAEQVAFVIAPAEVQLS